MRNRGEYSERMEEWKKRGRKENRRKRGRREGGKEGGAERVGKKRGTDALFHLMAVNSETH